MADMKMIEQAIGEMTKEELDITLALINILKTFNFALPSKGCIPKTHTQVLRQRVNNTTSLVKRIAHNKRNSRQNKENCQYHKHINVKNNR